MTARKFGIKEVAATSLIMAGSLVFAVIQAAEPAASRPAIMVFDALDTDKDGMLSPQEFQTGYPGLVNAILFELRLRDQFQVLDTNKSGAIEADEYANLELVKRLGQSAPAMSEFDANKNQKLEFAEYEATVRQLTARAASEQKK